MTDTQVPAAFSTAGADLPNMLKVVALSAGTDGTRPVLASVLFEHEAGQLRLTATDSYTLFTLDTGIKCDEFTPFLVPASDLPMVLKVIATKYGHCYGHCYAAVRDGDSVTFKGANDVTVRVLDADYPAYRNLLPAPSDCAPQSATFNPKHVERIGKAVKMLDKHAKLKYVGGKSDVGPQVFTAGGLMMIVMALRP